jgi:hypothetical protein
VSLPFHPLFLPLPFPFPPHLWSYISFALKSLLLHPSGKSTGYLTQALKKLGIAEYLMLIVYRCSRVSAHLGNKNQLFMSHWDGRQEIKICVSSGVWTLWGMGTSIFCATNTTDSARPHYFWVHKQTFGVRDAGTHLNRIAACQYNTAKLVHMFVNSFVSQPFGTKLYIYRLRKGKRCARS